MGMGMGMGGALDTCRHRSGQKSLCDSALCLKSENAISVEVKVFEHEKEEYKPEG